MTSLEISPATQYMPHQEYNMMAHCITFVFHLSICSILTKIISLDNFMCHVILYCARTNYKNKRRKWILLSCGLYNVVCTMNLIDGIGYNITTGECVWLSFYSIWDFCLLYVWFGSFGLKSRLKYAGIYEMWVFFYSFYVLTGSLFPVHIWTNKSFESTS